MLKRYAHQLDAIDDEMAHKLDRNVISTILNWMPDPWLASEPGRDPGALRVAYSRYLLERLRAPRTFVEEAIGAH